MSLKITRAGLLDTVQDGGRYGYQHLGINPGGAMDRFSASLANALLGKPLQAPVLELHYPPAQIRFDAPCVLCLSGADFTPLLNGLPVAMHQPVAVRPGTALTFGPKKKGARCYLALLNEFHFKPWLGSYSTNLKAGAGGFKGRKLAAGDELTISPLRFSFRDQIHPLHWRHHAPEVLTPETEFIAGNEWDWMRVKSQTQFLNEPFTVTPASDRMGYRLSGPPLEPAQTTQLVSSAVNFGTVQLLPNGQLIVLMADHQTVGGYPRIAHVAPTDLPKLAQKNAGEPLKFVMIGHDEAAEKALRQHRFLLRLQNTCNLKMTTALASLR